MDTTQSPRKQKKGLPGKHEESNHSKHVESHHKASGYPVRLVRLGVSSKHWLRRYVVAMRRRLSVLRSPAFCRSNNGWSGLYDFSQHGLGKVPFEREHRGIG